MLNGDLHRLLLPNNNAGLELKEPVVMRIQACFAAAQPFFVCVGSLTLLGDSPATGLGFKLHAPRRNRSAALHRSQGQTRFRKAACFLGSQSVSA